MAPEGWEEKPLSDLLDKVIDYRGQSVPKAERGVPLITARNVREGFLDFSAAEYVDESVFDQWMNRGVPAPGDILFTTEAPLGNACRFPEPGKYAVGQRTVTLRVKKKELDSDFLLYFLLSERGQRRIDIRSSGSTAKGIKSSELKKINVLHPKNIEEQRKIAKILSTWDEAIATTEQLLANSEQQKKALMQQLLTGKKRLPGFEGEWVEKPLKELAYIKKGEQINRITLSDSGLYPVINGGVSPSGYTNNTNCESGAITISEGGNSCGYIGLQKYDFWCGGHCYALRDLKIAPSFLYQLLKLNEVRIMRLRVGSGLPNIQKKDIEKLVLLIPPTDEERNEIGGVLAACDAEIDLLERDIEFLRKEKAALMQQLLTGKRRVKVDETEKNHRLRRP